MERSFLEDMRAALPALRAVAQILLRDSEEAEDLLQECLLLAWKDRGAFREAQDPRAWFLGHLRVALSGSEAPVAPALEEDQRQVVRLRAPDDQELVVHCNETLRAFSRLPPQSRQALELMAEGVSYEEAAHACRCCLGTFKSRLTRARELLAELVNGAARDGESVVW